MPVDETPTLGLAVNKTDAGNGDAAIEGTPTPGPVKKARRKATPKLQATKPRKRVSVASELKEVKPTVSKSARPEKVYDKAAFNAAKRLQKYALDLEHELAMYKNGLVTIHGVLPRVHPTTSRPRVMAQTLKESDYIIKGYQEETPMVVEELPADVDARASSAQVSDASVIDPSILEPTIVSPQKQTLLDEAVDLTGDVQKDPEVSHIDLTEDDAALQTAGGTLEEHAEVLREALINASAIERYHVGIITKQAEFIERIGKKMGITVPHGLKLPKPFDGTVVEEEGQAENEPTQENVPETAQVQPQPSHDGDVNGGNAEEPTAQNNARTQGQEPAAEEDNAHNQDQDPVHTEQDDGPNEEGDPAMPEDEDAPGEIDDSFSTKVEAACGGTTRPATAEADNASDQTQDPITAEREIASVNGQSAAMTEKDQDFDGLQFPAQPPSDGTVGDSSLPLFMEPGYKDPQGLLSDPYFHHTAYTFGKEALVQGAQQVPVQNLHRQHCFAQQSLSNNGNIQFGPVQNTPVMQVSQMRAIQGPNYQQPITQMSNPHLPVQVP